VTSITRAVFSKDKKQEPGGAAVPHFELRRAQRTV